MRTAFVKKQTSSCSRNGREIVLAQYRSEFADIPIVSMDDAAFVPGDSYSFEDGESGDLCPLRFDDPQDENRRNLNTPADDSIAELVWYDVN